jgi:hypothetical protein
VFLSSVSRPTIESHKTKQNYYLKDYTQDQNVIDSAVLTLEKETQQNFTVYLERKFRFGVLLKTSLWYEILPSEIDNGKRISISRGAFKSSLFPLSLFPIFFPTDPLEAAHTMTHPRPLVP